MNRQRRSYRYRQVKFNLKEEEYARLESLARELGMTPTALAKEIVLEYLGLDETVSLAEKVRELDKKYERMARELRRIEKDLAYIMRTVGVERGLD